MLLQALHSLNVVTALAWIPGHSGIFYNERADSMAKQALTRHADVWMSHSRFHNARVLS